MNRPSTNFHSHRTAPGHSLPPVGSIAVFTFLSTIAFSQDIRAEKDLIEIPTPPPYGAWIATALAASILALLLWRFLRRPRRSKQLSAAETALAELDSARPLIENESPEPLVESVAGTVRRYIEARFGIAAPRQTTEEFMETLKSRPDPRIAAFNEDLRLFLRRCDQVKFGRGAIDKDERHALIESARRFVETSHDAEEPPTLAAA